MLRLFLTLVIVLSGSSVLADSILDLRREFNQIAASIDTLSRLNADQDLASLWREDQRALDVDLVLVFWADDEAEIFLNGYRIGETRLTPTRVEIPSIYLRENNVIQAHCWDTDKVESGFMAGLYLRDATGAMRPVLVTGEGPWRTGGERAEVRYYAHSQPDIPGAEIIWGPVLFGELWLEAEFSAGQIQSAQQHRAVDLPAARELPMEAHQVVSRLVRLQERRQELSAQLERVKPLAEIPRYKGYITGRLAFTLGRAGRLAESESQQLSENLHQWANKLPAADRELVFHPPRQLKGVEAAVAARALVAGGKGDADRQKDYLPPPDRQAVGADNAAGQKVSAFLLARVQQASWMLWSALAALFLYAGFSGHRWWLLFKAEEWRY